MMMPERPPIEECGDERCPVCGWEEREAEEVHACPDCGFVFDEPMVVLDGGTPAGATAFLLALMWIALAAGGWFIGELIGLAIPLVLGALHLFWYVRQIGPDGRRGRLIVTARGVGLVRYRRLRQYARWHLFDTARIRPADGGRPGEVDRQPWRLTIVNAYKPSISSFLHSRGTEAAVFHYPIEFIFRASAEDAEDLRDSINESIDDAARAYRALDLKTTDHRAADPAVVLRLWRCPRCERRLDGLPRIGQCPGCGFEYDRRMFLLNAAPMEHRAAWGFALIALVIGALSSWAFGWTIAAVTGAAMTLAIVASFIWRRVTETRRERRRLLVTGEGIEDWRGFAQVRVLPWDHMGELRTAQTDLGAWRLAIWPEAKSSVTFSRLLFTWITDPPGPPVLDVMLRGGEDAGRIVVDEIERRREAAYAGDARRVPPTAPLNVGSSDRHA